MNRYQRAALVVALMLVAVIGVACSGSSDDSAKSDSPNPTAVKNGDAQITSFEVPASAECAGKTSTTVTVSYATKDAEKRELYVDGRPVAGTERSSGSVDAAVHCDPLPHTFVMVAYDAENHRTALEKKLTTNA